MAQDKQLKVEIVSDDKLSPELAGLADLLSKLASDLAKTFEPISASIDKAAQAIEALSGKTYLNLGS